MSGFEKRQLFKIHLRALVETILATTISLATPEEQVFYLHAIAL